MSVSAEHIISACLDHSGRVLAVVLSRLLSPGAADDGGREHLRRAAGQHRRQDHPGGGHQRRRMHLLHRVHQGLQLRPHSRNVNTMENQGHQETGKWE